MLLGRKALGTCAYMGGVPAVLEPFCWSWGQLVAWNAEALSSSTQYVHYTHATISDHGPARNSLANSFLGDWLWMTDCDHSFDPDIVDRMVRISSLYDIDVLTGVYQFKNPPHAPVLYTWPQDSTLQYPLLSVIAAWPQWKSDNKEDGFVEDCNRIPVIQVGSAGAGCLLIKRKVFNSISEKFGCGPFDKCGPYSEDHSFFWRCRELDIKCYSALNVHSQHLRIVGTMPDDLDNSTMSLSAPFAVEGFA